MYDCYGQVKLNILLHRTPLCFENVFMYPRYNAITELLRCQFCELVLEYKMIGGFCNSLFSLTSLVQICVAKMIFGVHWAEIFSSSLSDYKTEMVCNLIIGPSSYWRWTIGELSGQSVKTPAPTSTCNLQMLPFYCIF